MKNYLNAVLAISALLFFSCGSDGEDSDTHNMIPQLTTTAATDITTTTVKTGGNIIAEGHSPITSRGVVWDTEANPTVVLETKTVNGAGVGSFTANLTGLSAGTEYHLRAYATNAQGTFYGNEITFTTLSPTLVLGQAYRGGIIAYFLKPGDPGYSASVQHGLIVNPTDNDYAEWDCYTLIGGTSPNFGTGLANTTTIDAACSDTDTLIAGVVASTYGGQTDWYVPSREEMLRMWKNWDDGLLPADLFTNKSLC